MQSRFRNAFTILCFNLVFNLCYGQNVGINSTGATPDASAMLDVASTAAPYRGLLIPRIALTSTGSASPITSPTTSLLVYNTANVSNVTPGYYYWTGAAWARVASAGDPVATPSTNAWSLIGGNSLQSSTYNTGSYVGTSDSNPLRFRTNATQRMFIDATNGGVAIGANPSFNGSYPEKLLVDAGGTQAVPLGASAINLINGKGYNSTYLQLNVQNLYNGATASSDVVATNNTGTEANLINFVDMGINSTGNNTTGILGGSSTAYLYSTGNDFSIGNATASRNLKFFTNGTADTDERMRITSTGLVGIGTGTTAPTQRLDVNGNIKFSGAIMPGGDSGAANEVLVSQGSGNAPVWLNPNGVLNNISWLLTGNANASEQKIGTINNFDLPFYTNNSERMRITTDGNFRIGTTAFNATNPEKFLVSVGGSSGTPVPTANFNAINAKGYINNYLQLNVQNQYAGTAASSDIVATANDGSENNFYIDMGINSSANTAGYFGGAHDAYLYTLGEELLIGTGTAGKSLKFLTGGSDEAANTRMTINGSGNIGIGTGTVTAGYRLEISGSTLSQGNISPKTTDTYDLGTSGLRWRTIYAQNALSTSDRRKKTNISNTNYGLSEIMKLQPVTYNWNETPQTNKQLGLIAQDVKKLIPEVVKGDETKEMLAMDYNALIPVLINAIKDQQKLIEALQKSDAENKQLIRKLNEEKGR